MDTVLTTDLFITLGILWLLLIISYTNKVLPREKSTQEEEKKV